MLTLTLNQTETFDENLEEFVKTGVSAVINLEHSLVSLSKWEAIHKRPFLGPTSKDDHEIHSYVTCMLINDCLPPNALTQLTMEQYNEIQAYIDDKQTATTFVDTASRNSQEIITSELVYYWMISFAIPFECQHWHLNRLFALIRVCSTKNGKPKKMSAAEISQRNRDLNEQRKQQLGTKG